MNRKKIYMLAYADDVVIIAKSAGDLQRLIDRLGRFLERKQLVLNVGKSKIMIFKKGGRGARNEQWRWKGQQIETVKEFKYLGYTFQTNNGRAAHLRVLEKKAEIALRRIWGIGERRFSADFKLRMKLYNSMVKSILMYGSEVWGWEKWEVLEKIRAKYIRWVLGLTWNTPKYIVLEEGGGITDRGSVIKQAYKYEAKIVQLEGDRWVKECGKWNRTKQNISVYGKGREKKRLALGELGLSEEELERMERDGMNVQSFLLQRVDDIERQGRIGKIDQSKYNVHYKKFYPSRELLNT